MFVKDISPPTYSCCCFDWDKYIKTSEKHEQNNLKQTKMMEVLNHKYDFHMLILNSFIS